MPSILPKALTSLVEELSKLPGVGPRTAERYAYFLLNRDQQVADRLSTSIATLHREVATCPVTFALIDASEDVSPLYSSPERDKKLVAIVENPLDIVALERTGNFRGTYHVLDGLISPIEGVGPEKLHIPELLSRLKNDHVEEVILAMNASVEGESTALFIQRQLEQHELATKVSRLARGLPIGIDLEYADQITLTHALQGRQLL